MASRDFLHHSKLLEKKKKKTPDIKSCDNANVVMIPITFENLVSSSCQLEMATEKNLNE